MFVTGYKMILALMHAKIEHLLWTFLHLLDVSSFFFFFTSIVNVRVCVIKSVDNSTISAFCVHECEGSTRMGSRPRRYLFTGHSNGSIQVIVFITVLEKWYFIQKFCRD